MTHDSLFSNVMKDILSGKSELKLQNALKNDFDKNGMHLAKVLAKGFNHKSCKVNKLILFNTFLSNQAIQILANGLSTNKTISTLMFSQIFYNIDKREGLKAIGNMLKKNKTITRFFFINTLIKGKELHFLTDGIKESRIEWLNIAGNEIKSSGLKFVAALCNNPHCVLRYVDIGENQIAKTALERTFLPVIRKNLSLTFVDIYGNMYSEALESQVENQFEKEMKINVSIQKLWKEFYLEQPELFLKQVQTLNQPKQIESLKHFSHFPFYIQFSKESILKVNFDLFMTWVKKKQTSNELNAELRKLRKYKKHFFAK